MDNVQQEKVTQCLELQMIKGLYHELFEIFYKKLQHKKAEEIEAYLTVYAIEIYLNKNLQF